ncbi:hypothetical protein GIY11_02190 [Aerococcaceae bacterium DSM 109653]|uniref:Transposase n=1 Tax=Fundicoccus ignavus TaxID=2664442 RepID=A0A844BL06_9LACT|nr:hypothetical protein [Fundicoccus ignavus]MRI80838.1 hypothetical protein [Fundicoccus ignavus]
MVSRHCALTDIEAYRCFFPERYQSKILYEYPKYDDIHKELQRVGVTLKILWQEYVDGCRKKESITVGYSKFWEDYQKHIAKYRLANHLTHKPRVTVQVDWGKSKLESNVKSRKHFYSQDDFSAVVLYILFSYLF